jgi:hypothetical protein
MKKGEIKKVAQPFAELMPDDWRRLKNEFVRRSGDWLQFISFNASRFSDAYNPVGSLDYLKMSGPAAGSLCVQSLRTPKDTQRWISLKEHERSVQSIFSEMADQFRPSILEPLREPAVLGCLESDLDYWPHVYALCVMAAETGDRKGAESRFKHFLALLSGREDNPHLQNRRAELEAYLSLMESPEELRERLARIEAEKLAGLGTRL